jgi:hypothetical protein
VVQYSSQQNKNQNVVILRDIEQSQLQDQKKYMIQLDSEILIEGQKTSKLLRKCVIRQFIFQFKETIKIENQKIFRQDNKKEHIDNHYEVIMAEHKVVLFTDSRDKA